MVVVSRPGVDVEYHCLIAPAVDSLPEQSCYRTRCAYPHLDLVPARHGPSSGGSIAYEVRTRASPLRLGCCGRRGSKGPGGRRLG